MGTVNVFPKEILHRMKCSYSKGIICREKCKSRITSHCNNH